MLLLFAAVIVSCSGSEDDQSPPFGSGGGNTDRGTSVEVSDVERSEISRQIRSFGTVRAQDMVSINPQLSERVMTIEADLGDTVSAGQIIARLYDVSYRDQLRRDRAEHRQREITMERDSIAFGRQSELYNRQLLSASEYDDSRAAYRSSVAAYEASLASLTQSAENLKRTEIRSPVNGVITDRMVAEGDIASSGQPMFEIANLAGYEIRLYLPMRDWRETRINQTVDIRNSGDSEFTSNGVITRKSPDVDEVSGLGQVVVSVSQTGGELFPGALTEARIYIETRANAVIIPRIALIESVQTVIDPESNSIQLERTYSAFIVEGDTLASRRDLELGIQQGDRIEVLGGLEEGEQLIITGQAGLEDRARVRPATLERNQIGFPGADESPDEETGSDTTSRNRSDSGINRRQ
ncbi:MAG: efflux RND transporter periplasmic adaptor subunit [Balneolales bacterium]